MVGRRPLEHRTAMPQGGRDSVADATGAPRDRETNGLSSQRANSSLNAIFPQAMPQPPLSMSPRKSRMNLFFFLGLDWEPRSLPRRGSQHSPRPRIAPWDRKSNPKTMTHVLIPFLEQKKGRVNDQASMSKKWHPVNIDH